LHLQILFRVGLWIPLLSGTGILHAQAPPSRRLDLSVTYVAEHSLKAQTSQDFWMQGGSIELGANVWRGWGIAANVTGTPRRLDRKQQPAVVASETIFGPRYRWHPDRRVSTSRDLSVRPTASAASSPRRQGRSLTPTASPHNSTAVSTTGSQTVSPCVYSTRLGADTTAKQFR
jgi:hypothetical protein